MMDDFEKQLQSALAKKDPSPFFEARVLGAVKRQALERRAVELKAEVERLEALRRELRAEIVPYTRGGALIRASDFS